MFLLRTTLMPSLQKLLELERIVVVDNSGPNTPVGQGTVRSCLVGEFTAGPFVPTILNTPGDAQALFMPDPTKMALISQSGFDPTTAVQDGSGVAFDGNGWAELKGKTFSGLVIQRVDCDMVVANSSVTKAFVSFTVTVNAADITAGVTNKDIIIPAGTRFADNTIGLATTVVALSQNIRIPSGTTCAGSFSMAISFTQDSTGQLTYVTSGATTGATAFFVKGTTLAIAALDTLIDGIVGSNPLPGVNAGTVISGTPSTINASAAATAVFAPAGGGAAPAPDTLSNRLVAQYVATINKTLPGVDATNDIVAIWSARNYQTNGLTPTGGKQIRAALWQNAIASSNVGRGRKAMVTAAPALGISAAQAVTAKAVYTGLISSDGVTGSDADRYWTNGPFVQVFSTELNADILISDCGSRAAMVVNLANDGRSQFLTSVGDPFNATIQNVDAQEPCFAANPLQEADYIAMKTKGVAWFTKDRSAGWWFYSGVTAADPVLFTSRVDDNRRSFADEIQDVVFALATKYSKLPGTQERQDAFANDMRLYLEGLVNPGIGESRALAYLVKDGTDAGNTATLNGQGVFLYELQVQMYGSQKTIVINSMIGPNVIISQAA
jgi:hypothetical protein